MGRRIGIKDVAEAAGVSVTTVSHILNEAEGKRINPETRQRVLETAQRLGYAPNGLARGLRLKRSSTVGFVSDRIATTPFAGQIILGAQEEAAKHDLLLLLLNTGGDPELERKEIELLLQRQVDGVLYASMYHRVVEVPEQLRSVPTVLLDARADDPAVPSVVPDEVQGGYTAVHELLRHGHRRIGFLNNVDNIPATHGRLAGYRQALAEAGVAFDPGLVVTETSDAAGGYRAALGLLQAAERPTALFCFTDRMAMGAYHAAAQLGLSIPADLSVIGFDNQELICDGMFPGLTTVALPHYEMGARAVVQLLALTGAPDRETGPVAQEMLPCPLVARASVASPPRL
ncbi:MULTISPECIES: LacI family DNA-binding transcriptional regulator [unclassified Streptomyces]|uniref:LacI family DNA-binding transcriptional regulator n=1 Tax=unclassified Streptomyces TaxID=2593676 RepID=UPI002366CC63|nr:MULTISPECIES: LacI family DNA-binding transcriptional regulator [unclassified Streptomyces]MDF3139885.1 LacI family DNA-binding transcriptional regulator [Streptomyces sp. T21Q-yed]WDF41943.1 LacI family DNA-binding transcriptional regulator [Streptomyces sp. T12]